MRVSVYHVCTYNFRMTSTAWQQAKVHNLKYLCEGGHVRGTVFDLGPSIVFKGVFILRNLFGEY